jgi:hypothetical protein
MSEEFSAGVNILLQRMETHPEEFYIGNELERDRPVRPNAKWQNLMNSVMQVKFKESARGEAIYLTDAEVDALYAGYTKIRRKAFDDQVLDEVLNPQKLSSSEDMISKMQGQMGQPKIRLNAASNNINDINRYGNGYADAQGMYDVDTNQYRNAAQAHAQHIAAHQEATARLGQGLMNANPYQSSQNPHPQPMSESMLSRINKRLGFK